MELPVIIHQLPQGNAMVQHLRNRIRKHRQDWQQVVTLWQTSWPILAQYRTELENFQIERRTMAIHVVVDK